MREDCGRRVARAVFRKASLIVGKYATGGLVGIVMEMSLWMIRSKTDLSKTQMIGKTSLLDGARVRAWQPLQRPDPTVAMNF